ncbi:NeuD/PglB/VioB family sugar acetyltransferase [Arthrobacter rhombi]|uniref:NeuD/PglB/VioB family sugar acetyltransferase n=1 Tax=Arthrobacter rhombi TaxID=71253 RepID=UPI003F91B6F3
MARLLLIAAGGLARETIASIRATGDHHLVGLLDDDAALHGRNIAGVRVLGGIEMAATSGDHMLICAGSGAARAAVSARLEAWGVAHDQFATHVHSTAVIGEGTVIGAGSIILAGTVLTCDVRIGHQVVLMPQVTLTHDDDIADFVTLAAGASVGGRVEIGRCSYLGMNAAVRQDLKIGEDAVLGMGAVLLEDLPTGETWAGNPARMISTSARPQEMAAPQGGIGK